MTTNTTGSIVIRDPFPRINYGWTCPKCNKVWNPSEIGCRNCNQYYPSVDPYTVPDQTPWTNPYPLTWPYPISWPEGEYPFPIPEPPTYNYVASSVTNNNGPKA